MEIDLTYYEYTYVLAKNGLADEMICVYWRKDGGSLKWRS